MRLRRLLVHEAPLATRARLVVSLLAPELVEEPDLFGGKLRQMT